MNSKTLICLALLLSAAILTPMLISLLDLGIKTNLVIELNEEEESQEVHNDIDQIVFFDVQKPHQFVKIAEKLDLTHFVPRNMDYNTSLDILLPPPRSNT